MAEPRFWWPVSLSAREEHAFDTFRNEMRQTPLALNTELVEESADKLAQMMQLHIEDILERDGIPHHCHLINGWGDARFGNRRLIDRLDIFTHRNQKQQPFIMQCDPEGDFHPWQTFAYALMAGVDVDETIPSLGAPLRTLMNNSRQLNTGEGRELGHLLFALSYLGDDVDAEPFMLAGERCDTAALMAKAIEAHHFGTFEVCRKFHLTEGLCAMAASVAGVEQYRAEAQGFLEGQLGMLLILALILREARALIDVEKPAAADSLLQELRHTLVIGNCIENHFYYAGHIVELAAFAALFGYEIAPEYWRAMAFVINELNRLLPVFLPKVAFQDSFLHFGHYRRAMTLLVEVLRSGREISAVSTADLRRYTVDFDALSLVSSFPETTDFAGNGVYEVVIPENNTRPVFEAIVSRYAMSAPEGLKPRGKFEHFRRIGPPSWPRAFHYEFLDYGGAVGVEIHLESDMVLPLREPVRALTQRMASLFPQQQILWDETWYRSRGRLCVIFDSSSAPEAVASGMHTLIDETFSEFDAVASRLAVTPSPWWR